MSTPPDANRRRLLMVLGAGAVTCASAPVAASLVAPAGTDTVREGEDFVDVVGFEEILAGEPLRVVIRSDRQDAWTTFRNVELGAAWILKNDDGSVVAYSAACPHLGCAVDWKGERSHFECPCHDAKFTREGGRVSGPAPRGLDRLQTKVADGRILVRFSRGNA